MQALSIQEIEALRKLVLENAFELYEEAEILFQHKKFARTYALAHLASEELAKLLMLASVGVRLANKETVDWKRFDKQFNSHPTKLTNLLFVDFIGKDVDVTKKDRAVGNQNLSRVELFNTLKNVSIYAGKYQDSLYKPSSAIPHELALAELTATKERLDMYSAVEAVTQGRISNLAKRKSYMNLLSTLGTKN